MCRCEEQKKCHQKTFDKINSIISTSLGFSLCFLISPITNKMWHFWCVIWNLNLFTISSLLKNIDNVVSHEEKAPSEWNGGRKEIMKHKTELLKKKYSTTEKRRRNFFFILWMLNECGEDRKQWKNFFHPPIRSCRCCQIPRTFVLNFKLKLFSLRPIAILRTREELLGELGSFSLWAPFLDAGCSPGRQCLVVSRRYGK